MGRILTMFHIALVGLLTMKLRMACVLRCIQHEILYIGQLMRPTLICLAQTLSFLSLDIAHWRFDIVASDAGTHLTMTWQKYIWFLRGR